MTPFDQAFVAFNVDNMLIRSKPGLRTKLERPRGEEREVTCKRDSMTDLHLRLRRRHTDLH